ncbi:hypothetical protein K439DRAFT_1416318 [Ramaria rubella]|nr:hypothetical protein K439DRAFT_1416318 [Ramaria rubella]
MIRNSNYNISDWELLLHQQADVLDQQTDLFRRVVETNKCLEERIYKSTEDVDLSIKEVEMWKKAFIKEQQKNEKAEEEVRALRQQLLFFEGQKDRGSVVLALIDGDGYIFEDALFKRGRDGGREAAQMLNESIACHNSKGDKNSPRIEIWTYVFCNLQGLQHTLVGSDICTCEEFEAFMMGFNQANPRFTINDVHAGKEAADAKVKAYLHTWSRFPQTVKVYFGGGHDNGYHPTLSELQSDGLLEKIVLLQGYQQIANEIRSFHLQTLQIDNLFRTDKIPTKITGAQRRSSTESPRPSYTSVVEGCSPAHVAMRPFTPSVPPNGRRLKHVNPNLELHKHSPPPCNLFYLSKCAKGGDCKYSHDYILEAEHYEMLRENAKKSPCPAVNIDSPCPFGDHCALGHKCPQGPQCFHRKLDKCWFKGSKSFKPYLAKADADTSQNRKYALLMF